MSDYAEGIVVLPVLEYIERPMRTRRAWYGGRMSRERLCVCGVWLPARAQRCESCCRAFNSKVKRILRWDDAHRRYRDPETAIEDDHILEEFGDGVVRVTA